MGHPFQYAVSPGPERRLLLALFVSLGALVFALWKAKGLLDLKSPHAPNGIISLELANGPRRAQSILAHWEKERKLGAAKWNVYLDFLYILAYSNAIAMSCVMAANAFRTSSWLGDSLGRRLATFGLALAWQQWLAGLLDVIENIALLRMLDKHINQYWTRVACCCAVPKFGLVLSGLFYTLFGILAWVVGRIR